MTDRDRFHAASAASPPALRTQGLTKRFGQWIAVDAVNLNVPRGCAFGLVGHNGADKTTLIRMLLGLTTASAGRMELLGRPLPAQRSAARRWRGWARSSRSQSFTPT